LFFYSKRFFFEKKKQKTFGPGGAGRRVPRPARAKVFLLLFFQKKKRFLSVAGLWPGRQVVDAGFRRHDEWGGRGSEMKSCSRHFCDGPRHPGPRLDARAAARVCGRRWRATIQAPNGVFAAAQHEYKFVVMPKP
jgi:hypothetical protein